MAKTNKQGFILLEVLIAIFIITVGIVGAVGLLSYSVSAVAVSKSQIIATNLAQEGIELVRNIRDSNWIEQRVNPAVEWNDGLDGCLAGCRVQYNKNEPISLNENPVLLIDSSGFYGYEDQGVNGKPTFFRRKITIINNPDGDPATPDIGIISEVTWGERGRDYEVRAQSKLYDWK